MLKKFICAFMVAFMLVTALNVSVFSTPEPFPPLDIVLEVGTVVANPYDIVNIPIIIKDIPEDGISNLDFVLTYDTSCLNIISIEPGEILKDHSTDFVTNINSNTGRMVFMFTDETGTGERKITEEGEFASITARVSLSAKEGYSEINLGVNYERFTFIKGGVLVENAKITLELETVKGNQGDIVKIPLNLTTMPTQGIEYLDFILGYDPDDLVILSIDAGDIIENSHINFASDIKKDGRLDFMYTDESGEGTYKINELGVFATLTVMIKDEAKTGLSEVVLLNVGNIGYLKPIGLEFINGGVEIEYPIITIEIETVKGNPGDIVKIPLNLTTMPLKGINNVDFILRYNTDDLDILSIDAGDIIENASLNFASQINENKGLLSFMFTDESGTSAYNIRELGEYAIITARIKEEAQLGLSEIVLHSIAPTPWFCPIRLEFINGGVEITNNDLKILGDLNGDGVINSKDYVLLKRYILEIIDELPVNDISVADLNGDGKIDSVDYTLLRRYILEIISDFPAN
ncbi:UNVERIFIED_CONTAM: dockerin type I repeat protein [Acetivibrio alkalicellulosi]